MKRIICFMLMLGVFSNCNIAGGIEVGYSEEELLKKNIDPKEFILLEENKEYFSKLVKKRIKKIKLSTYDEMMDKSSALIVKNIILKNYNNLLIEDFELKTKQIKDLEAQNKSLESDNFWIKIAFTIFGTVWAMNLVN